MKTYNNLTQIVTGRLVYFRSTDVEQKNYHRLLWSIPDEWFYLLSKEEKIIIKDKSSNHKGKIERIFIPVLIDLFNFIYLGLPPKRKDLKYHFDKAIKEIRKDKSLETKLKFWINKIKKINIQAITKIVKKEPNLLN